MGGPPSAVAPYPASNELPSTFTSIRAMLDTVSHAVPSADQPPVVLDLFSGANAPLTKAFLWCGWQAVTPIDLEIDIDFDVTSSPVQKSYFPGAPTGCFHFSCHVLCNQIQSS